VIGTPVVSTAGWGWNGNDTRAAGGGLRAGGSGSGAFAAAWSTILTDEGIVGWREVWKRLVTDFGWL